MIVRMATTAAPSKPIRTAVIAMILILGFICATVVVLKKLFAPAVTKANAQMLFDAFDNVVNKGTVEIGDESTAVAVANECFRRQTDSPPLDGWGHVMRVTAAIASNTCKLTLRSAGADNIFDTPDDVVCEQSFDISRTPGRTGSPASQPDHSGLGPK